MRDETRDGGRSAPVIQVLPASLSLGKIVEGAPPRPYTAQLTVAAHGLDGELVVRAPAGLGLALDSNGPLQPELRLPAAGADGQGEPTPIYISFLESASPRSYSGLVVEVSAPGGQTAAAYVEGQVEAAIPTGAALKAVRGLNEEIGKILRDYVAPLAQSLGLAATDILELQTLIMDGALEDFEALTERDPAARERLEEAFPEGDLAKEEAILFLHKVYPSMQSVLWYRVASAVYHTDLIEVESVRRRIALGDIYPAGRLRTGIDIDPRARIGRRFVIDHGAGTVIGRHTTIGDDCYILHYVNLGSGPPRKEPAVKDPSVVDSRADRHPRLGNRVTIYGYVSVLGGIEVGDDSVIGTRCILTESIPEKSKVRIVNQYQILRTAAANEEVVDIYGLVPSDGGAFQIVGANLSQPRALEMVDEYGDTVPWLSVELGDYIHTSSIAARVVAPEPERNEIFRSQNPRQIREALIRSRLRIHLSSGGVVYISQAQGLRRAIEEALQARGLWND